MEACSGAHHWARVMHGFGLTPKIMAAEFVKPFRKSSSSKNDRNDAEATVRAITHRLNHGTRKCLGRRTPFAVFFNLKSVAF
jgi:transposase